MKQEFMNAIFADLGKNYNSAVTELYLVEIAAEHDLKHLKSYMKDIIEQTELFMAPGHTRIHYEPLGVCAVYSAWNYPIMLALKPLVQCIASGNATIVKPSEIAPNVSKTIKKFVDAYLDSKHIRCIEGGVDVAVELNS